MGTPAGSLGEISGTFKWGNLRQVCYRAYAVGSIGETKGASTHGEPLPSPGPPDQTKGKKNVRAQG